MAVAVMVVPTAGCVAVPVTGPDRLILAAGGPTLRVEFASAAAATKEQQK